MRERLRDAFDQITADETLKQQTRVFLAQQRRKPPAHRPVRRLAAVAVCLLCLLLGVGGWAYLTPTSAISIESDAALELEINRFDRVIAVRGTDDAGCALAQTLNVRNMPYLEAIQVVLAQQESGVSIGVVSADESRCQAVLQQVQADTAGQERVSCYAADPQTLEQARAADLPLGKYRMLLVLQQLDPSITADDVRDLRMRDLRRMQAELSGEDQTTDGNGWGAQNGANENGQNGNGKNGNGQNGNGQNGTGAGKNGAGNGNGAQGTGAAHGRRG